MPVPTIYIEKNLERGMRKPEQRERSNFSIYKGNWMDIYDKQADLPHRTQKRHRDSKN